MKRFGSFIATAILISSSLFMTFTGCSGNNPLDPGTPLIAEPIGNDDDGNDTGNTDGNAGQTIPTTGGDLHPIFAGALGMPIARSSIGAIDPDPTGHNPSNDFDGDGIANDAEIISNPFVADYPQIVTRISAPITMEIRISESSSSENHTETLSDSDMKDTITNSMEDKHYTSRNKKTTPYVTKESYSASQSHKQAYGSSDANSWDNQYSGSINTPWGGASYSQKNAGSKSHSQNSEIQNSNSSSTMSEKTVFEDVMFRDKLDREGKEFTSESVNKISKNYRTSEKLKNTQNIGPNDGIVRAALFIKNLTINIPARISNVVCTLSFRTPAGEFLPVKTFKLRNEDYSEFDQEVYGDTELGPFTIEIADLNTAEVRKALQYAYVPQIHVVSYDMNRVNDSNYNPGVDNLKIVEENAKGRTATIKIVGKNMREIYRVCAFDVDENGAISPGVSLKKALYNIFKNRVGAGETWDGDNMTVPDSALAWKTGLSGHGFAEDKSGDSWEMFETYVKTYTDEYGEEQKIETIKRIGDLQKYNPFSTKDNESYDPNELLAEAELLKMKYWTIYHNGRYFHGDINDAIWAGERYEIVFLDLEDFNNHFKNYHYTPLQSMKMFSLDTRWNRLTNNEDFSRAMYLGKVVKGDVINLEVDLMETRMLFNPLEWEAGTIEPAVFHDEGGVAKDWYDFNYTFESDDTVINGIPKAFTHSAVGGTNTITVAIVDAQFAGSYVVSYKEVGADESTRVNVPISLEELKKNYNVVRLDRHTLNDVGDPIGRINGGIQYAVDVKAVGSTYGVTVNTSSSSNNESSSIVTVEDPAGITVPGIFNFTAVGEKDQISVNVSAGNNIEFYQITVKGPFNYFEEGSIPEKVVYGNPGTNIIPISAPTDDSEDPGVYTVTVRSVNSNSYENDAIVQSKTTLATAGTIYLTATYERFQNQKIDRASIYKKFQDLRAIDLEVNFNDGSGWYRLRLANDDLEGRSVDCRYTSYVEQNKQKFYISFSPPAGADDFYGSNYTVFNGGCNEVDVYIRTVAEQKYRDTFWLKKQNITSGYEPSLMRLISDTDTTNFINEWINNKNTDASCVEETLSNPDWFLESSSDISEGALAFSNNDINNYFFSPLEQRSYLLKASLTDKLVFTNVPEENLDLPTYSVSSDLKSINVSNISSIQAEEFRVFWKPGNSIEATEDIRETIWKPSELIQADENGNWNYKIKDLVAGQEYIIAVKGYKDNNESEANFYDSDLTSAAIENLYVVIPKGESPVATPGINVHCTPETVNNFNA